MPTFFQQNEKILPNSFRRLIPIPVNKLQNTGRKLSSTEHGSFWLKIVRVQSNSIVLSKCYWKYKEMTVPSDMADKIGRDVGRTYPESKLFQYDMSLCQKELTNVLHAWVNFEIEHEKDEKERCGYVQGMNLLVGHLLQHLGESLSFEIFLHIMLNKQYNFKELLEPGMKGTIEKVNHLSELCQRQCGFLYSCLTKNNILPMTFSTQWLLTLYTYVLDGELLWLVWDNFFLYGWEFFFNITIEFMKGLEERLKIAIDRKILETYLKGRNHGDMMSILYNSIRNIATRNSKTLLSNDDPIGGSKVLPSRSPENWIQRALSSLDIIDRTTTNNYQIQSRHDDDKKDMMSNNDDDDDPDDNTNNNANSLKLITDEKQFKYFKMSESDKERLMNTAWEKENDILRNNAIQYLKYSVKEDIDILFFHHNKRRKIEMVANNNNGNDAAAATAAAANVNNNNISYDILTDIRLFRYLRGCKFDMRQTIIKLKNTLKWRREEDIEDISLFLCNLDKDETSFPYNNICSKIWPSTILHGKYDRTGQPILIERFGKCDLSYFNKNISSDDILEWVIHRLEYRQLILSNISRERGKMVRFFGILDLNGLGFQHCSTSLFDVGKKILKVSTSYFPEAMSNICVINTPYVFSTIYNAIHPLLPERTQKKVRILGYDYHEKLKKFVAEENLPMEYRKK